MARFAVFPVKLRAASTKTVRVHYATQNGTATAPQDYTHTEGTLEFAPGQTVKEVRVPIRSDAFSEAESFSLKLSIPVNASIGSATGTATIPAEGGGLDGILAIRDLTVQFYKGESHPGSGPELSDEEWTLHAGPATQDSPPGTPSDTPFPGYQGQFVLAASPDLWVRAGEPIVMASGWIIHYLIADYTGGESIMQCFVTNNPEANVGNLLDPATAADFHAWWTNRGDSKLQFFTGDGTLLCQAAVINQDPTAAMVGMAFGGFSWPQDQPELGVTLKLVPLTADPQIA